MGSPIETLEPAQDLQPGSATLVSEALVIALAMIVLDEFHQRASEVALGLMADGQECPSPSAISLNHP